MVSRPGSIAVAGTLLVVAAVAGCGPRRGTHDSARAAHAAVRRGYVREDDLIALSPLQADLLRLEHAETRLRQLARNEPSAPPPSGGADLLPALDQVVSDSTQRAADYARAEREQRLISGQKRLELNVDTSLDQYAIDRARLQERLLNRRKVELKKIGEEQETKDERAARDGVYDKAMQDADRIAAQIPNVQSGLAALSAQVGHSDPITNLAVPGTLPPPVDNRDYEQQLDVNAVDPKAQNFDFDSRWQFITMFARLENKNRAERGQLNSILEQLHQIEAQAAIDAERAADDVAQRRSDQIDLALEDLNDGTDLRFQIRDLHTQLGDVLKAQNAVSAQTEAATNQRRGGLGSRGAGSVRFTRLFGATQSRVDRAGAAEAADRVGLQLARLRKFIKADVETAVKDAAAERNLDVIFVSNGMGGAASASAGRIDMTAEFIRWTKPGASSVIELSPMRPGWPVLSGGASNPPGG